MKPLIFFFIFGLSAFTCFTQDTLVDSKGLIFPARITAVDSNFITYASPDTLIKEQIIIPRSTIIFIKYENGKTEQLYVSDTLITKEGLFITCKVLEIDMTFDKFKNLSDDQIKSVIRENKLKRFLSFCDSLYLLIASSIFV